ncbi:MAG: hypothetical protein Q8P61_02965 [Candidatus Nanopelagicales bacterium]|nr:hypothetical protein [Candidatus Nanopelagicales bacterium]
MRRWLRSRRISAVLAVQLLACPFFFATSASAAGDPPSKPQVVAAVNSLRQGPPIFVDPKAPLALQPAEIRELEQAISTAGTPIVVAILPSGAGRARDVARQLRAGVDRPGTYVAISGEVYEATSDVIDVRGLMQRAFASGRNNGTSAVLIDFVELAGARAQGREETRTGPEVGPEIVVIALVVIALIAFAIIPARRRPVDTEADESRDASVPTAG